MAALALHSANPPRAFLTGPDGLILGSRHLHVDAVLPWCPWALGPTSGRCRIKTSRRPRPPKNPEHRARLPRFLDSFAHNYSMRSDRLFDSIGLLLCGACLFHSACGGHSGLAGGDAGGTNANPLGGATALATGGTAGGDTAIPSGGITTLGTGGAAGGDTAIPSGGTTTFATGGTVGGATTIPSGGATTFATGGTVGGATTIPSGGGTGLGTAGDASAGTSGIATGGTTGLTSSGTGGASAAGGSTGRPSCGGVACPSLPASCKKIVQDPSACCPTCTDTGCEPCADLTCATGTHKETPVGACCPVCVADPPDPCTQGQQNYAAFRVTMLDKVGTLKCQNSTDCTLLLENNACEVVCNVAVPATGADSFQSNLSSMATQNCAACPAPASVQCERMVAACMNGKCVAANPS